MIREALEGPLGGEGGEPGQPPAQPSLLQQLSRTVTSLAYFMKSLKN